ncbi:hypothetical protein M427DRAFT_139182 [Gonapodya prolifera JEL478]|uniref:Uncharacterized protein n=1 Tax=Gonapodya prolifera (strain JEL478) TaxID=1344416 RepID=A0A139A2I3_GONPJ|nr:hypothetical protein M427DRAFT_139182 [Gonapodya prolifera JEL478]|eukprot:KXS10563.1 hypothetical protein M427DRAFT_139182 [Gonapodya prolifera JEL478]
MASREVFVKLDDQIMLDYPDDNAWNSIDEFGQPLPCSHAERTLRCLVIDGCISPRS